MRIQHNIMAMNSYRNYTNNSNALSKNLEKLSSGYKINRAGDDAAGLAISEKMRAQITGLEAAQKNVKDGISLVKTAEGAMDEIHSMLKRMDYLATQSANGTYDEETDRDQLQKEINQLRDEINRIADSSNFNGIKLLDGSLSGKSQVDNLEISTTKAQKGVYEFTFADVAKASMGETLESSDIGKTFDYTISWKDSNGQEQTTTVKLTYQGADGKVHDDKTLSNNYFTDAAGTRYNLGSTGSLGKGTIAQAIANGLKSNDTFNSQFTVELNKDNGKVTLTARKEGSDGSIILGAGVSHNTGAQAYGSLGLKFDGRVKVATEPLDTLQKFNVTSELKVAKNTGDDLQIDKLREKIFEVDGHKFLLSAGVASLTPDQIRALGDDVTIIKIQGDAIAADDAEHIAAEISRVTGLATKGYNTKPGNADNSGIAAGDIVFTKDWLKLSGGELQLQIGDTSDSFNQLKVKIKDLHTTAIGINEIDISTQDGAADAIDYIKKAINYVSDVRGTLGATQNRLEHTQNNLSVMTENIQDAESTIRDTDVAEEMMSYVKNNILVQSAQAMLAQANQVPQGVLQLLG